MHAYNIHIMSACGVSSDKFIVHLIIFVMFYGFSNSTIRVKSGVKQNANGDKHFGFLANNSFLTGRRIIIHIIATLVV